VFKNRSQPLVYTTLYSSIANRLTDLTEVRAAWLNQDNNNYVRIMDLDSVWGNKNGIGSVIPRVLLFSTLGYRYVLPDMVGGNGYGERGDLLFRGAPNIDLYIRWIQMNLLLPMQLSIPTWRYEANKNYKLLQKVVKDVFNLRNKLISYLRSAVQKAIDYYIPIAMPMWYLSPDDHNSFNIDDQYCIDGKVVIAPILQPNSTNRMIYLPAGLWTSCDNDQLNIKNEDTLTFKANKSSSWALIIDKYINGPNSFLLTDIYLNSSTPCFIKITI
jgi:alpha-glucosidase (family GH31 glycosyl hydrolase)